jgi:hypothetical protein
VRRLRRLLGWCVFGRERFLRFSARQARSAVHESLLRAEFASRARARPGGIFITKAFCAHRNLALASRRPQLDGGLGYAIRSFRRRAIILSKRSLTSARRSTRRCSSLSRLGDEASFTALSCACRFGGRGGEAFAPGPTPSATSLSTPAVSSAARAVPTGSWWRALARAERTRPRTTPVVIEPATQPPINHSACSVKVNPRHPLEHSQTKWQGVRGKLEPIEIAKLAPTPLRLFPPTLRCPSTIV